MGKPKVIEIIINEDGTFSIESNGVSGEECIDDLQKILAKLVEKEK